MKNHIKVMAVSALLAVPVSLLAADSKWYNPKNWFKKSDRISSTTVTGNVDSIKEQVTFKTLDGQILLLIGNKAEEVGKCGPDAKVRVFGNVCKPSDKYPAGALQVRDFRIIEVCSTPVATESAPVSETKSESESEPAPEPYEEPTLESTQDKAVETEVVATKDGDDAIVEVVEEDVSNSTTKSVNTGKTYVVQSGDTLGKISSKVFGTTAHWKKIAEANGITNPKHLKVGMTLNIPE